MMMVVARSDALSAHVNKQGYLFGGNIVFTEYLNVFMLALLHGNAGKYLCTAGSWLELDDTRAHK